LLTLLEGAGTEIPEDVRRAESLTPYAALARYPGVFEPVTQQRLRDTLSMAEAVIQWVEEQLGQ